MEIMTTLERQIQRDHSLLESDSENIDLMLTYAHNCLRRDLRFEALTVFQKVLEQKDSTQARMAVARIFYLQKLYKEAYGELEKLFVADPVNIDGHLLLHRLKEKEPVPESLAMHLEFVPARTDLNGAMLRIRNERDLYMREVKEYKEIIDDRGDVEPVIIYDYREAKARAEGISVYLDLLSKWEEVAIDIPGFLPDQEGAESGETKAEEKAEISAESAQDNVGEAAVFEAPVEDTAAETKTAEIAAVTEAEDEFGAETAKTEEASAEADGQAESASGVIEEQAETEKEKTEAAEQPQPAETTAVVEEIKSEVPAAAEIKIEEAAEVKEPAAEENQPIREAAAESEDEPAERAESKIEADAGIETDIHQPAAEAAAGTDESESVKTAEDLKAVEETVAEPEPEPEIVLPSQEVLDREALFVKPLENMCKIKGDIRVFILSKDLRLAASCGTFENIDKVVKAAGACVSVAVKDEDGEDNILSWTCEYKEGSIIISDIKDGYHLIVEGRNTTLGVLRQRLERCKAELMSL